MKYAPVFPERFGSLSDARAFLDRFVAWYNHEHHHTGIGLHTAADVHYGLAAAKTTERAATLAQARAAHPHRFNTATPPKIGPARGSLDQPPAREHLTSGLTPTGLNHLDKFHFGPFFIKFSTYFPFTAKLCLLTELPMASPRVTGHIRVKVVMVPARDRIRRAVPGSQCAGGAFGRWPSAER